MRFFTPFLFVLFGVPSFAQSDSGRIPENKPRYSLHFQTTIIPQYHFQFRAAYTGNNSLLTKEPVYASLSATAFLNYRVAKHTYIVGNPEVAGGKGLSQTQGIAGFPNGEVYRVGDPQPRPFIARLYLEHRFPLTDVKEKVADDLNTVGEITNRDYLSLLMGKFSLTDFFDDSQISHDPRSQFMNWSLMGNGAWDYPANTRGYTLGAVVQAVYKDWGIRTAITTVPIEANGPALQFKFGKAMGLVIELERAHLFQKNETHFSTLHVGSFINFAQMGNYNHSNKNSGIAAPDITDSRKYGRKKYGFYVSMDNHLGLFHHFVKMSWNDGQNESWAFTEIDRSLATGLQLDGNYWQRKKDHFGLAFVSNEISLPHREYLRKGGYGFIIGDGNLHYGAEQIWELYYACNIVKNIFISPGYQYINRPAYNADRGPVHIIAVRLHMEW